MTVGQSIKLHRTNINLTQKDLAEKLNVSYQTISKWENDTNEPDVSTLKAMCSIFECSIDELVNCVEQEKKQEKEVVVAPIIIPLKPEEKHDEVQEAQKTEPSIAEEPHFELKESEIEKHHKGITDRNDSKVLIWSIVIGCIVFVCGIVCSVMFWSKLNPALAICLPIIGGYGFLSVIYCIFSASYISEVFMGVASWSIKFPGIIFSFSLDGLKFLIAMKLLFWVLGVLISIGTFLLALTLSMILSIFSFPFILYANR